jgi:hypothetical protein
MFGAFAFGLITLFVGEGERRFVGETDRTLLLFNALCWIKEK